MHVRDIHRGDIVLVSKGGRLFHATVAGRGAAGALAVVPLDRGVRHRVAAAREVVDHWAHRRGDGAGPRVGQISFDELLRS